MIRSRAATLRTRVETSTCADPRELQPGGLVAPESGAPIVFT